MSHSFPTRRSSDLGYALSRYGVTSGMGLKAELDRLRLAKTFRSYIDHRVANRAFFQSVSESVEQSLKFMRRYVSYTFPRSLLAISNIQAEVLKRNGRDRKSTRLNSSHYCESRMPSAA